MAETTTGKGGLAMLKSELIHPEVLAVLGQAGHGSKVLLADGNYPCVTKLGVNAELVSLNLSPGVISANQVLKAIVSAVPIEKAEVMKPSDEDRRTYKMEEDPLIWREFQAILNDVVRPEITIEPVNRVPFYGIASDIDVALVIATGEQRIFANILLTIGVIVPK